MTLTTLGYGDISPLSGAARSVAVLEALVGQVFMVVLVARLVAMHVSQGSVASPPPGIERTALKKSTQEGNWLDS